MEREVGEKGAKSEEESRASAMEWRVARTAAKEGIVARDVELIRAALRLAFEPRSAALPDEHHFDLLHPGRTVLVLLSDTDLREGGVLAGAGLMESERADLRVDPGKAATLDSRVAELLGALPRGSAEEFVEELVTASREIRLAVLAERLDHLRHAHLWSDPSRQREAHREAVEVYEPVAGRTDPTLARRFRWWCRTFERDHLNDPRGTT